MKAVRKSSLFLWKAWLSFLSINFFSKCPNLIMSEQNVEILLETSDVSDYEFIENTIVVTNTVSNVQTIIEEGWSNAFEEINEKVFNGNES